MADEHLVLLTSDKEFADWSRFYRGRVVVSRIPQRIRTPERVDIWFAALTAFMEASPPGDRFELTESGDIVPLEQGKPTRSFSRSLHTAPERRSLAAFPTPPADTAPYAHVWRLREAGFGPALFPSATDCPARPTRFGRPAALPRGTAGCIWIANSVIPNPFFSRRRAVVEVA